MAGGLEIRTLVPMEYLEQCVLNTFAQRFLIPMSGKAMYLFKGHSGSNVEDELYYSSVKNYKAVICTGKERGLWS